MRWLASAMALPLLAGCFGMCDLSPSNARWTDASLYAAMPGDPVRFDWVDDTPGFPLEDPALDQRWGNWTLTSVSWQPEDRDRRFRPLTAMHDLGLHASYANVSAFRAAADDFAAFVAGFSSLGGPNATVLMERMIANGTQDTAAGADPRVVRVADFSAALPPGWSPQPAWDALPGINVSASDPGAVGSARLEHGPWVFSFAIPFKQIQGEGYVLSVDAAGNAVFEGLAMGEGEEQAYRARVLAELQKQGLPVPSGDTVEVGGSIC